MELLKDQTQEEDEQAEDGKLEAVGNRDEAAEEELADKAKDPSVYSSEDVKKSPRGGVRARGGVRTEDGDHSNSKSKRNKTTSGGVTFGGLTGRGKKAGGGLTSGGKRAGGTKDRGNLRSRLTGGTTVTQMTRKKIQINWIYRSGRKSATRKRNRKRRK